MVRQNRIRRDKRTARNILATFLRMMHLGVKIAISPLWTNSIP
jgi:hypothetical protein